MADLFSTEIDFGAPVPSIDVSFLDRPDTLEESLGKAQFAQTKAENHASIERCVTGKYAVFRNFLELVGVGRGRRLIIVGGDPTINETLPGIRRRLRLSKKTDVMALNKSDEWLRARGVEPDYAAMCDPRDWVADYMRPRKRTRYLLASQLAERTLDKFLPFADQVFSWHVGLTHPEDYTNNFDWARKAFPGMALPFLPFGSTVGLLMIVASAVMDFDDIEVHGFASCFHPEGDDNSLHAYAKPATTRLRRDATVKSLKTGHKLRFVTNEDMARQAVEFGKLMQSAPDMKLPLGRWRTRVHVAGRGVIPWLAYKDGGELFRHATPERMTRFDGAFVDYRPEWAKACPIPSPPKSQPSPMWGRTVTLGGPNLTAA